jgi:hypothetical protein
MKTKTTNGASLLPLITEAERTVAECIKHFGLKVRSEQISITVASKGRKSALGWFWGDSWSETDQKKGAAWHEINLCAEHIGTCDVGELIIHEMAHAENHVLGIRDCTGSRMHNKHFKSMAERLGLTVEPRNKSVGYGYTKLGPDAEKFLTKIAFRRDIFHRHRRGAVGKGTASGGSRMIKCECNECGYVARITRQWIDKGLPTCACGGDFHVA